MKKRILTVLMQPEGVAPDEVVEAVEWTVTTILADQIRAEHELRMRKAGVEEAPVMFGAALAWAALAREGWTSLGLDEFAKVVFDIKRLDDAGDVDPTQPAALTDSASGSPSHTPAPDTTSGSTE